MKVDDIMLFERIGRIASQLFDFSLDLTFQSTGLMSAPFT